MARALEAKESRRFDGHRSIQQPGRRRVERFPAVAINAEQFAAGAVFPDERIERTIQKTAIGLIGDPVPVRIGSGAAMNWNTHRLRAPAASASAVKSQLSMT